MRCCTTLVVQRQYRTVRRRWEERQHTFSVAPGKPFCHLELFERQAPHWLLSVAKGLETRIRLEAIDCDLALAEVYERVI